MVKKSAAVVVSAVALFLFLAPRASADQIIAPQVKYYRSTAWPIAFLKTAPPYDPTAAYTVTLPGGATVQGTAYLGNSIPLPAGASGRIYVGDLRTVVTNPQLDAAYTVSYGSLSRAVQFSNGNTGVLNAFLTGFDRWRFNAPNTHYSGFSVIQDCCAETNGSGSSQHVSIPNTADINGQGLQTVNGVLFAPGTAGMPSADGSDNRLYSLHAGAEATAYALALRAMMSGNYFTASGSYTLSDMIRRIYDYQRFFTAAIQGTAFGNLFPGRINYNLAPNNLNPAFALNQQPNNGDDPQLSYSGSGWAGDCARRGLAGEALGEIAYTLVSVTANPAYHNLIATVKQRMAQFDGNQGANYVCSGTATPSGTTLTLNHTLGKMRVNFGRWLLDAVVPAAGGGYMINSALLASSPYKAYLVSLAATLATYQVNPGEAGANSAADGIYGYFADGVSLPQAGKTAVLRYYPLHVAAELLRFAKEHGVNDFSSILEPVFRKVAQGYIGKTFAYIDAAGQFRNTVFASPFHPALDVELDGGQTGISGYWIAPVLSAPGGTPLVALRHYPGNGAAFSTANKSNATVPGAALALYAMARAIEDAYPADADVLLRGAWNLSYSMYGFNALNIATIYGGAGIKNQLFSFVGPALPCYASVAAAGACSSANPFANDYFATANGIGNESSDYAYGADWPWSERHLEDTAPALALAALLFADDRTLPPAGSGFALGLTPSAPSVGMPATIAVTTSLAAGSYPFVVIANVSSEGASSVPYQIVEIPGQPPVGIYIPLPVVAAAQGTVSAGAPHATAYTLPLPGQGGYQYPPNAKLNLQLAVQQNGQWVSGSGAEFVMSVPIAGLFGGRVDVLLAPRSGLGVLLLVLVALTSILAFVALPKSRR